MMLFIHLFASFIFGAAIGYCLAYHKFKGQISALKAIVGHPWIRNRLIDLITFNPQDIIDAAEKSIKIENPFNEFGDKP